MSISGHLGIRAWYLSTKAGTVFTTEFRVKLSTILPFTSQQDQEIAYPNAGTCAPFSKRDILKS